jgi:hypothetical protein
MSRLVSIKMGLLVRSFKVVKLGINCGGNYIRWGRIIWIR